ncbi:hypothetical protein [Prescottella equi]|uniref:hypothetical protein n=1 Tax=Rhodococcus hoagii TaxID=43767 RepID=UPI000A115B49|nr:hypothetical protein [Prescottella equi]ORJ99835.1 hypothetical protein A6F58_00565 [Prescottella equi]
MSTDFVPETIARPGTRTMRPAVQQETAEQHAAKMFAVSTTEHQMTVLHDDGVYRHIRFAKPGTGLYHWDLVTWPGHLCIDGDLESFTFSREHDMFGFFAMDRGRINPQYWAEKITNRSVQTRVYRPEKAKAAVVEEFLSQRHWRPGPALPAWEDLRMFVLDEYVMDDEHEFQSAVSGWSYGDWRFEDTYEWDLRDWDHHYLIACHAIAWGVQQYRAAKAVAA